MAITYPLQKLSSSERFLAGFGFNNRFINRKHGFDLGERFHRDADYRVQTLMEIDRAIYSGYKVIGLGYSNPMPRPSVEPFGHRFIPRVYGCECAYAEDSEPWAVARIYSEDEINALEDWTPERFERESALQETMSQAEHLHQKYGYFSSLPNLGSVINTGISLLGDDLFIDYLERPDLVRKLYDNITQLMILCVEYFQKLDGAKLDETHIGNCTVSMISPSDYMRCDYEFDRRFMLHCEGNGTRLVMHQDSDVTSHLDNYAKLEAIEGYDFGMDTDFARLAGMRPDASVNCIWFPQWLMSHSISEIEEEVFRIFEMGRNFRRFSCSLYEIDEIIGDEKLFAFHEALIRAAEHSERYNRV